MLRPNDIRVVSERIREQLKESRTNNMMLARGWLLAVRYMHYFSVHIRNVVAMDYSVGDLPNMMEDTSSRSEGHLEKATLLDGASPNSQLLLCLPK